jgi:glucosamine-6-phosphate deaminase
MIIIKTKDYMQLSKICADVLIEEININPQIVLGLPTGSTPLGMYRNLVLAYKKRKVNFSKVKTYNIDEYYPIKKSDKNSYYHYMHNNFFDNFKINKKNINILDGETEDPKKECRDFERKIRKSGIDIMILGVGVNGHIGFNEPFSSIKSKTRIVKLDKDTVRINSRFFKNIDDIPKHALTIGISTILSSKSIILLASGKNKAKAVSRLVDGPISSKWPVSFLKKHDNLIVICDREAGRYIKD